MCQECGEEKPSTRYRNLYAKDYVGPCADSFCYAGCDMSACRPVNISICDGCVPKFTGKAAT